MLPYPTRNCHSLPLLREKTKVKKWNWKHIVLLLLAIPAVKYVGGYLGKSAADSVNERSAPSAPRSSANQEIRVVVSSQDSEGATQRDFDSAFLKNLEAYTVERIKNNAKKYLVSQGYPSVDVNLTSEAIYVESGHMKLAVIRVRAAEGSNQVFVAGIVDNDLKRVVCITNSKETIPISYGPCATKITEVFGVKIGA